MMEKIKLNNQVVIMRKHVKQAKVHTINKLVKQVKLLQNRKGSEIQILKSKRKAERYLEEISLLKKMKPDDISKLALSKAKDWKEVLLQKNSTLEDRCVAMLATYESVKNAVEVFLCSNKELTYKIPVFITQWEEKHKLHKDSPQSKKIPFEKSKNYTIPSKVPTQIKKVKPNKNKSEAVYNSENVNSRSCQMKIDDVESKHGENKIEAKSVLNLDENKDLDEIPVNKTYDEHSEKEKESNDDSVNKVDGETSCQKMHFEKSKNLTIPSEIISQVTEDKSNKTKSVPVFNSKNIATLLVNSKSSPMKIKNNKSKNCKNNTKSNAMLNLDEYKDLENVSINKTYDECSEEEEESEDDSINNVGDKISPKKIYFENSNYATPTKVISQVTKDKLNKNEIIAVFNPMKIDRIESKHSGNKIKAITKLNLDELKDLDEIPINRAYECCEDEESNDDSVNNEDDVTSEGDPFFLGHDEAVSSDNKLVDNPKNNIPMDRIFDRKEKLSYQSSFKKDFQKPLNHSHFRDSSDTQNKKCFKTFKKDKFTAKKDQNGFQHKYKNSFERKNFKNNLKPYNQSKDKFIERELKPSSPEPYENNRYNLKRPFNRNEHDKSFRKSKDIFKKNDADIKPIHPSWEAKRKQKEFTNVPFQGKRKVFDD